MKRAWIAIPAIALSFGATVSADEIRGTVVSADAAAGTLTIRAADGRATQVVPEPGAVMSGLDSLDDLAAGDEIVVDARRSPAGGMPVAGAIRRPEAGTPETAAGTAAGSDADADAGAETPPGWQQQKKGYELILETLPQRFDARLRDLKSERDDMNREIYALEAHREDVREKLEQVRRADGPGWARTKAEIDRFLGAQKLDRGPYWERRGLDARRTPLEIRPQSDRLAESVAGLRQDAADERAEARLDRQMDRLEGERRARHPRDFNWPEW